MTLELSEVGIAIDGRALFDGLSLRIAPGEIVTLMGPSGAGKSTLLAFISGTLSPVFTTCGRTVVGGRDVTSLDPQHRRIGILFQAVSAGSASGRFRRMKIDLRRTPFLNWSWKVVNTFPDIDETKKAGDDFPARIFVVVERGAFGAGSGALNYVWSSRQPVGSLWPSPYSDRVRLLAVDSGTDELDRWVSHKRDLRSDLKAAFGADVTEIDGVALMTDTDNHGGTAEAYFGEIWFSAE